jgi:hypothetical protein
VSLTASISIDVPRCVPILLTNEHFSRILIKWSPTFGVSSILLKALGCALLTILSPVIGLAILADSLIGNHEVRPMIGYVKNNLNLKLTDEQCSTKNYADI